MAVDKRPSITALRTAATSQRSTNNHTLLKAIKGEDNARASTGMTGRLCDQALNGGQTLLLPQTSPLSRR